MRTVVHSDTNFNRISAKGSKIDVEITSISSKLSRGRAPLSFRTREHRDRIGRPVYIYPRSRRIGAPDKETPPSAFFFLESIACTVAIIFDVYIISLGRSLINSSRSSLLLSHSLFLVRTSLSSDVLAYQVRHEALPVPGGIDFDAQHRNMARRRKKLVYLPLCPSASRRWRNFGPGCRSLLAQERTTKPRFLDTSIEVEEASEWSRRWCSRDGRWTKTRGVANDEGEAATAV